MAQRPTPAEVLRFIAENESFERTRDAFPSLRLDDLRELLRAAASAAGGDAPRARPIAQAPRARPLSQARLRVFSDGAARGNPGPAGAGAVIESADGRVLARLGRYLGRATNNQAEYQGLILGLEHALEMGAREVEVFADSELLVRQLRGEYRVRNEGLLPLWREAKGLLDRFEGFRLTHIPREKNVEADEMSNRAIDERL